MSWYIEFTAPLELTAETFEARINQAVQGQPTHAKALAHLVNHVRAIVAETKQLYPNYGFYVKTTGHISAESSTTALDVHPVPLVLPAAVAAPSDQATPTADPGVGFGG